jgi:hypothetical protein
MRGHEAKLNLTGHVEVALHTLFLFVDPLIASGVGDADGNLRCQGGEGSLVVLVVIVEASMFQV